MNFHSPSTAAELIGDSAMTRPLECHSCRGCREWLAHAHANHKREWRSRRDPPPDFSRIRLEQGALLIPLDVAMVQTAFMLTWAGSLIQTDSGIDSYNLRVTAHAADPKRVWNRARQGHIEVVRSLTEAGSDKDKSSNTGSTPLRQKTWRSRAWRSRKRSSSATHAKQPNTT